MGEKKLPNNVQHPERYKNVVLFFNEPELWGCYAFYIPKVALDSFKEKVLAEGGCLEIENTHKLLYMFEGEGAVLKVHKLAEPYMYRY